MFPCTYTYLAIPCTNLLRPSKQQAMQMTPQSSFRCRVNCRSLSVAGPSASTVHDPAATCVSAGVLDEEVQAAALLCGPRDAHLHHRSSASLFQHVCRQPLLNAKEVIQ